jgi:thioredoxin-like negative regulator of GroEL
MSEKSRKQQIEEMLALDPDDSFLRYGLAMEHVSAGQDEEAAEQLVDLIGRDPGYVAAYLQAGQALIRLGRDEEARKILQDGIAAANKAGNDHAAGEMAGFLQALE